MKEPDRRPQPLELPAGSPGSCVALGAWNVGLTLNTEWLRKKEIITDDRVEHSIALSPAGTQLNAFFSAAGNRWHCTQDRLELIAEAPDGDPGQPISKLLRILNHTPVTAVGNNYFFHLSEHPTKGVRRLFETILGDFLQDRSEHVSKQSSTVTLLRDDNVVNVSLQETANGEVLRLNYHRHVSDAHEAADVADGWQQNKSAANRLFEVIMEAAQVAET